MSRRWLALLALGLAGCAAGPPRPQESPPVELTGIPFFPQERYQCGPAALATALVASGAAVTPDDLVPEVYLPALHGSLQVELLAASRRNGRVPFPLAGGDGTLEAELAAGRPVIVLQNFGSRGHPLWHYAVVVGREPGYVLLRSGSTRRERVRVERFEATWERADRWAVVVLRPGELPVRAPAGATLEAAAAFERVAAPADALAVFEAVATRWTGEAAAHFGLGNARARVGEFAGAEAAYRAALAVEPTYAAARNNLAELLGRRGCLAAARREAARAAADAVATTLAEPTAATRRELEARPAATEPTDCPPP